MASKEEGSEPLNYKTCVLKVSIHCEGCKKKVKKILKNVHGVLSVDIDALQNKVTVAGDVDAETLIRRLAKSGKNARTWPEKKPANPNPNPSPSPSPNPNTKPKEKNKEKESEPAAKEVVATATDKTPAATNPEPAAKPTETATSSEPAAKPTDTATKPADTATKPAETATKPAETTAEPAKKEAAESSRKEEAAAAAKPDKKPEKEPADTKPDTDTKPAETSAKTGGSGKKKGKKPEEPSMAAWEGHSGNYPLSRALPVYQVPVYAVSHNTAQPMPSHSYYYEPTPSSPQSYAHTGNPYSAYNCSQPQPQPPPPQQPEYYPSGNYGYNGSDNYYGSSQHSYSYYGSMASPSRSYPGQGQGQGQGQGELDMFNDENAHSCSVM